MTTATDRPGRSAQGAATTHRTQPDAVLARAWDPDWDRILSVRRDGAVWELAEALADADRKAA